MTEPDIRSLLIKQFAEEFAREVEFRVQRLTKSVIAKEFAEDFTSGPAEGELRALRRILKLLVQERGRGLTYFLELDIDTTTDLQRLKVACSLACRVEPGGDLSKVHAALISPLPTQAEP